MLCLLVCQIEDEKNKGCNESFIIVSFIVDYLTFKCPSEGSLTGEKGVYNNWQFSVIAIAHNCSNIGYFSLIDWVIFYGILKNGC